MQAELGKEGDGFECTSCRFRPTGPEQRNLTALTTPFPLTHSLSRCLNTGNSQEHHFFALLKEPARNGVRFAATSSLMVSNYAGIGPESASSFRRRWEMEMDPSAVTICFVLQTAPANPVAARRGKLEGYQRNRIYNH